MDNFQNKNSFEQIKVSSKTYSHDSKNFYRYFDNINKRLEYGTNNLVGQRISSSRKELITEHIKILEKVQNEYLRPTAVKRKFTRHIYRDKTLSSYNDSYFLNKSEEDKVAWGRKRVDQVISEQKSIISCKRVRTTQAVTISNTQSRLTRTAE